VKPLVTIVTPSFNQGQFLERTILSVLQQDYPNIEYIVMDGGSKDNSVEIIRKYEGRLKYWTSEKDKGQSDAINKGWRMGTGVYCSYLNSDDELAPGAVTAVVKVFEENWRRRGIR
jgi:glycosyltransferase involved in cell wall biosynthesis